MIADSPDNAAGGRARPRRDTWLTSALGLVLLAAIPPIAITGLLSNAAYDPRLGSNVLAQGRSLGPFDFYLFSWPTSPSWLYAVTQGIHVTLGLAIAPIVLAKLYSALSGATLRLAPRAQLAQVLERLMLAFLIGGMLFELITGLFEIEYFYPWGLQLISAHYYAGWIVIVAFVLHAAVKLPTMRRALATRRELRALELASAADDGQPDLVIEPGPTALTRRLVLGTAAAGSLLLLVQGLAQVVGGPVRDLGLLLPRGNATGSGPNDFEVNGTAISAGLGPRQLGDGWRVKVSSRRGAKRSFSREQLLALPQYTYSLPISCREGWSTTQHWTGVRLRDLAALVGEHGSQIVMMTSLDGATASLAASQVADDRSLLALHVNAVPLSQDHGFPARVVVPDTVGVNCLKWISALEFTAE